VRALPSVLSPEELAPGWRETAVLCVAGRGSLDEAAGSNAGTASGKARDRCPRGAVRGGFGGEPVSPRRDGRADGMSFYLEPGSFTNPRYLVRRYDAGCRRRRSSTGSGR